jgi:hypothetical protein
VRQCFKVGWASILAFMLCQCSDKAIEPERAKLGTPFVLQQNQSIVIEGQDLTVAFRSLLSDQRCPPSIPCFWAGMAEIKVALQTSRSGEILVTLGILGGMGASDSNAIHVDTLGYTIRLLQLDPPYPVATASGSGRATGAVYQATIVVTHRSAVAELDGSVEIVDLPPDSIQIDHFILNQVAVAGDTLAATVTYGGGVGHHYFFAFMSPDSFLGTDSSEAHLYLRYYRDEEAQKYGGIGLQVQRKLRFDLTRIAEACWNQFHRSRTIRIVMHGYNGVETERIIESAYEVRGDPWNHRPVINNIASKTVYVQSKLEITVTATDPDGTIPVLTAAYMPSGATFQDNKNGTALFTFQPTMAQVGNHGAVFVASDGQLADSESVAIKVTWAPDGTPILDSIGPKGVLEGYALNFRVSAANPDGRVPALSAVNLPANAAFRDSGDGIGALSFTPSYFQSGTYFVTFRASDRGDVDSEVVRILVVNVNRAPVVHVPDQQYISTGDSLGFLIKADDPDSTVPALYAINMPAAATFADHHDGTGSFSFRTDSTMAGTSRPLFIASDGEAADTGMVAISVVGSSSEIWFEPIGRQTVVEGTNLTFTVRAHSTRGMVTDIRAYSRLFPTNYYETPSARFINGGDGTGTFSFDPRLCQLGTFNVQFVAAIDSIADTMVVYIDVLDDGNQRPQWSFFPFGTWTAFDRFFVCVGDTLLLPLSAGDADCTPPNLELGESYRNASIINSNSLQFRPDRSQLGTNHFLVLAVDAVDPTLSDSLTISITVQERSDNSGEMMPLAIGNYWVYEYWEDYGGYVSDWIDSVEVVGHDTSNGRNAWLLSSYLPRIGSAVTVRRDSLFDGNMRFLLKFSNPQGTGLKDAVPAGSFIGIATWLWASGFSEDRAYFAPGVGLIKYYSLQGSSPHYPEPPKIGAHRLLRYHISK